MKERRKFLGYCLAFLGTVFAGGIVTTIFSYLQPPSRKKQGETVRIPEKDLPPGGMKRFFVRGIPAVAVNSKEGYAAYSLVCSHLGCLVTWSGEKNEFQCPCHGARFSSNGAVLSGPPPKGLERLNVEVREGEIWVS